MISKLKEMFVATSPEGGGRRGVDIEKRFQIQLDLSTVGSRGSMSRVFKAVDTETGKPVCLKILDREKNEAALARAAEVLQDIEALCRRNTFRLLAEAKRLGLYEREAAERLFQPRGQDAATQ